MKDKIEPDIDARQILSTCYTCEAVPNKSCTECGNLFCQNHGGKRYYMKGNALLKEMICDDCTPNQTIMRIKKNVLITFTILIFIFILTMAIYEIFFADHSLPTRPSPAEPVPVEPAVPVEEESGQ